MSLVTLDEVKVYLEIPLIDNTYDDFLNGQIDLFSETIENYCGRKFLSSSYTQTYYRSDYSSDLDGLNLFSFHFPLISIASIKEIERSAGIDSEVTLGSDDYREHKPTGKIQRFNEGIKLNFFSSLSINSRIEVAYDAGYAGTPIEIKEVCFALIGEKYNKKANGVDVNFGNDVQRVSIPGTISIDFDYTLQNNERKSTYGMLIGNYANVLDKWRSERVVVPSSIKDGYV